MSGSISGAILNNEPTTALQDPAKALGSWQALSNAQSQNALIKQQTKNAELENQTGQQTLAQKMSMRHAQIMYGLSNLPDDQLPGAASKALEDELSSGQIDQQRYGVMKQQLESANGDPSKIRPLINSGLIGNLSGPEAVQAVVGRPFQYNQGNQTIFGKEGGALSQNPFTPTSLATVQNNPGPQTFTDSEGVHFTNNGQQTGSTLPLTSAINVGGSTQFVQPKPGMEVGHTLNPGEAVQQQNRMVKGPNGWEVQQTQVGQSNPNLAPPGMKSSGPLGGGGYPGPQPTSVPVGTEKQVGNDVEQYQTDVQSVPQKQTGVQSLNKALGALQAVATGAGTEGLARMRSLAVSLGNVLGIDTKGVNVQDMNRAELEKYLTDYARVSGSAGRSDAGLEAAFKSNASGSINNSAAQDVVRTNIGRDRMAIAAVQAQKDNPQGYSTNKASYYSKYDPRGFAWDTYSPEQRAQIVKETQGKQGKDSEEYKKLRASIVQASQSHLLDTNMLSGAPPPQPVVSPPPGNQPAAPVQPPNALQAPQAQPGPRAAKPNPLQSYPNFLNPGYAPGA